jgi:thiol-disulfide isomerase/thioredoxin
MPVSRTYSKQEQQDQVYKELSKQEPTIVFIHKEGCPACESARGAWEKFAGMSPSNFRVLEVEEKALPSVFLNRITGFPTYAVQNGRKIFHHTGAIMDPAGIIELIDNRRVSK